MWAEPSPAAKSYRTAIQTRYPKLAINVKFDFVNGSERMRIPLAVNIALQTAGAKGGSAGSPNPVGLKSD